METTAAVYIMEESGADIGNKRRFQIAEKFGENK